MEFHLNNDAAAAVSVNYVTATVTAFALKVID